MSKLIHSPKYSQKKLSLSLIFKKINKKIIGEEKRMSDDDMRIGPRRGSD